MFSKDDHKMRNANVAMKGNLHISIWVPVWAFNQFFRKSTSKREKKKDAHILIDHKMVLLTATDFTAFTSFLLSRFLRILLTWVSCKLHLYLMSLIHIPGDKKPTKYIYNVLCLLKCVDIDSEYFLEILKNHLLKLSKTFLTISKDLTKFVFFPL